MKMRLGRAAEDYDVRRRPSWRSAPAIARTTTYGWTASMRYHVALAQRIGNSP